MSNKTTKKHFEIFRKESLKLIKDFGLSDWRIDILHQEDPEKRCCRGWSNSNCVSFVGQISLSPDWNGDIVTTEEVKKCALHEIGHILFCGMATAATERNVACGMFELEEHRVIRRMENLFYRRKE